MSAQLELHFSGAPTPELQKTIFVCSNPPERLVACRKPNFGCQSDLFIGQFSWTPAVQAATVLLLKTAACARQCFQDHALGNLEGGEESLAKSLDAAIRKEPHWLLDIFGVSERGDSNTKRVFRRVIDKKPEGHVSVSVDQTFLPGERIEVFIDGAPVRSGNEIIELGRLFENQKVTANTPEQGVRAITSIASAAARLQTVIDDVSDTSVVCLSVDVQIVILNERGDTEVCFFKTVENLQAQPFDSAVFDVWFDSPPERFEAEAWDEFRHNLPLHVSADQELYKRVRLKLPNAIGPFETGRYGYRYVVPKMFDDSFNPLNSWNFRPRDLIRRVAVEILDTRYRRLQSFMSIHETEDTTVAASIVKTSTRSTTRGILLSWTFDCPPVGHLFKTYWVGGDPNPLAVSDLPARGEGDHFRAVLAC